MKKIWFLPFVICLLIFSCKPGNDQMPRTDDGAVRKAGSQEDERLKNTVILYNALLISGYREQDMTALANIATPERAAKAFYHMAALGEGMVKMDAELKVIEFGDIRRDVPDRAEVRTEEKWNYAYIHTETGEQVYDNSVDYKMLYKLQKINGKWLISDVNVNSVKEKNPEPYEPFSGPGTSKHERDGK